MTTATTKSGHTVSIQESTVGTACREGRIYFGCILVAYYCGSGSQKNHSIEEGLIAADDKINALGLKSE